MNEKINKKQSYKFKKQLIVIFLVIVLLAVFWMATRQPSYFDFNKTTSTTSQTPTSTIKTTKSYSNSQYGFSFDYSSSYWKLTELSATENQVATKYLFSTNLENDSNKDLPVKMVVSVYDNSDNFSLGNWIDKYNRNEYPFEPVTVDGIQGRKYSKTAMGSNGINIYFDYNKKIFVIGYINENSEISSVISSLKITR